LVRRVVVGGVVVGSAVAAMALTATFGAGEGAPASADAGARLPPVTPLAGMTRATRSGPRLAVADHLGAEGGAGQLIVVEASALGDTYAQLQAFDRVNGAWVAAFAPMTARLGRNGVSPHHMEGDGTTPAGTFSMTEAFGNAPDPGTRLPYRPVHVNDEWVSDSTSQYYNTWQVGPANGRWSSSEKLWTFTTAYAYAVVIDYNRFPVVPYRGDGIFLHVQTGSPTSGCVAIDRDDLVSIMRWLDPSTSPRIAIGTDALLRA
jgi:L,D-peptidoglycan transpeptidase YkuD (ErfK/YbiS/YcfS/YnhG family)